MKVKSLILPIFIAASIVACSKGNDGLPPAGQISSSTQLRAAKSTFDIGELEGQISACENLFDFVNSKWIARNPIPDDRFSFGAFDQMREKSIAIQKGILESAASKGSAGTPLERILGNLYEAGMDEAKIEQLGSMPIKAQLDQINSLNSPEQVASYLAQIHAAGQLAVFNFIPEADIYDSSRQVGYALQGNFNLPAPEFYTDKKYEEVRSAYLRYIAQAFELTGATHTDAEKDAKRVFGIEKALVSGASSPEKEHDPAERYNMVSIAEADAITPHFSWDKYLKVQNVSAKEFSLGHKQYFVMFDRLLAVEPTANWRAYLRFQLIDSSSPYLSSNFVNNRFQFYNNFLQGQKDPESRPKAVLSALNEVMGDGLGKLYAAKAFTPEEKQKASELVKNVMQEFKSRLDKNNWMSVATKQQAINKLTAMTYKVGYPDTWKDWTGLNTGPQEYLQAIQQVMQFNRRQQLDKIGKLTDRNEWSINPQDFNARYETATNSIVVSAAVLQPPFFDATADDAINYGAIGTVIGHEITHGFDDDGSKFDGLGNRAEWWTEADMANFKGKSELLVSQFNAYQPLPNHPDAHVDGRRTMSENIADLGGINVAYDALHNDLRKHPERAVAVDGFTPEQRFFLAYAKIWRGSLREQAMLNTLARDNHSPANIRAIAAPSNMPQFAKAFACKNGDKMVRNDNERVVIW
ncbi:M13 family metallopeptidase [Xanthomonas hortorum]|uniref:M13 family metallopeptidase n=1 Tax=Xanthomonas hortorum TaxID=56454 RepID=UPI001592FE22|nr:M13 family metallopeptidase [Xanthomonas hortorum]